MTRDLKGISSLLAALGDERHLRILAVLGQRELCVCELVDTLRLPQYEVSRHLAMLKKGGLVADRREGRWVYYSVSSSVTREPFIRELLQLLGRLAGSGMEMSGELARLRKRLDLRVGGCCTIGLRS